MLSKGIREFEILGLQIEKQFSPSIVPNIGIIVIVNVFGTHQLYCMAKANTTQRKLSVISRENDNIKMIIIH